MITEEEQAVFSMRMVASIVVVYLVVNLVQAIELITLPKKRSLKNRFVIPFKIFKCLVAVFSIVHLVKSAKDLEIEQTGIV